MKRIAICSALLISVAAPSRACLQDRDSLATEARGVPDVMRALSGRFERNPPLYYEMRLKRVAKELESAPSRLDLYDDAAVALDRLGRDTEALSWMEKKKAHLQVLDAKNPEVREHWYRTHANEGTFYAHRWIHEGADRKKLREVQKARDLIAKAISIKPDAHFGREKYQLKAMQWILHPPKHEAKTKDEYSQKSISNMLGLNFTEDISHSSREGQLQLKKLGYADAERGLTGLITLGAAWQSIDVFNTLSHIEALASNSSVAYLLNLRLQELARDGRTSLHPQAPRGQKLVDAFTEPSYYLPVTNETELEESYKTLRAEADSWHARRTAFMLERLKAGRHPDTDARFWDGWDDGAPPSVERSLWQKLNRPQTTGEISTIVIMWAVGILSFVIGGIILLVRYARRRKTA